MRYGSIETVNGSSPPSAPTHVPVPRYAVNCSIMLTEHDVPDRLDAVRAAGFDAVEFWWPFTSAAPADAEVETFIRAVDSSGLRLVALNLFAGDMPAGDRGIVSWPGRTDELHASVRVAAYVGEALGCRSFNALYGNRQPGVTPQAHDELAVRNLAHVATELAHSGATVLVEPVSGNPAYPLRTADDVVTVLDRVADETGVTNAGLLLDVYHLATNGDDVAAAIHRHGTRIAHVQLADAPGRGAPGTGELPLRTWVADLVAGGYDGWIALEYTSSAADPFSWKEQGVLT